MALSVWSPEHVAGRGDAEVMRIAEAQRGVIHRDQLTLAGLTRSAVAHRRRTGWLHPLFQDVFLAGRPRVEPFGWETAAILHLKGFAVASHASGAALWDAAQPPARPTVTVAGREARSRAPLTVHRVARLHPDDVALRYGLPVTSAARTLLDRAGQLTLMELENELIEMRRRGHVTDVQVRATIDRAPHRAGAGALRSLVEGATTPALTRSIYERKLRRLLRLADLPLPLVNQQLLGYVPDFLWPRHRLIVEFDGFESHGGRRAFEHDRLRDQRLVAAGYRVIRITARQLDQTPYAVVARIAAALAVSEASAAA